jgi:hypothetical protein
VSAFVSVGLEKGRLQMREVREKPQERGRHEKKPAGFWAKQAVEGVTKPPGRTVPKGW